MLYELETHQRRWTITHPQVMAILNCTPDSFYAQSRCQTECEISRQAERMLSEGAAIIDIGGVSTRPGTAIIDIGGVSTRPGAVVADEEEEVRRLRVALSAVRRVHKDIMLSVDTFRPAVARMAVEEFGVEIINDVREGGAAANGGIMAEAARLNSVYVLMSVQPTLARTINVFQEKCKVLQAYGINSVILDPGYGFGKDLEQNYALLAGQQTIAEIFPDYPLLVGVSRKRMVYQLLGLTPEEALNGTTALHFAALQQGAAILRAHDVRQAHETIRIYMQLERYR